MLSVERDTNLQGNDLSDQQALILINEFAKVDNVALKLMIQLQDASDFGSIDMALNKIHWFLKGKK